MSTIDGFLRRLAGDERPGLLFEDQRWTHAEVVQACADRAALLRSRLVDGRPPHVGVLMDNIPEFVFWLGAAALSRSCIVGINPTRRGAELARDIAHSDCQLI